MTRNDWIAKEIAREQREDNRRIYSKTVKCIVCDRYPVSVALAKVEGPLCPGCRERVKREGTVPLGPDRGFMVSYKETT